MTLWACVGAAETTPSNSPHGKSFYFLQFSPCMWKVVVEKDSKCVDFFVSWGLRAHIAHPRATRAKKSTHLWLFLYYSGAEKKSLTLAIFGSSWNVAVAKKVSCDKDSKTKAAASSHIEQNFPIGCGPK